MGLFNFLFGGGKQRTQQDVTRAATLPPVSPEQQTVQDLLLRLGQTQAGTLGGLAGQAPFDLETTRSLVNQIFDPARQQLIEDFQRAILEQSARRGIRGPIVGEIADRSLAQALAQLQGQRAQSIFDVGFRGKGLQLQAAQAQPGSLLPLLNVLQRSREAQTTTRQRGTTTAKQAPSGLDILSRGIFPLALGIGAAGPFLAGLGRGGGAFAGSPLNFSGFQGPLNFTQLVRQGFSR